VKAIEQIAARDLGDKGAVDGLADYDDGRPFAGADAA
jgi:hypothetical protein